MTTNKRGPKTAEGKAIAATNATRHGVMALTVPEAEREDYTVHLAGVLESLAPVGYMEIQLAERVALTMWRLRRLDAWEAATLAASRDTAERALGRAAHGDRAAPLDSPAALLDAGELRVALKLIDVEPAAKDSPATMRETAAELIEWGSELYALSGLPPAGTAKAIAKLGERASCELGFALIDALRAKQVGDPVILAAIGDGADGDPIDASPYSAEALIGLWALLAETNASAYTWESEPKSVAWDRGFGAVRKGERLATLADRAEVLQGQAAGLALMPSEADQAKIQRYDSHLERALYKALHELEAMQERRRGGVAPLARVEVHGLGDGGRGA